MKSMMGRRGGTFEFLPITLGLWPKPDLREHTERKQARGGAETGPSLVEAGRGSAQRKVGCGKRVSEHGKGDESQGRQACGEAAPGDRPRGRPLPLSAAPGGVTREESLFGRIRSEGARGCARAHRAGALPSAGSGPQCRRSLGSPEALQRMWGNRSAGSFKG